MTGLATPLVEPLMVAMGVGMAFSVTGFSAYLAGRGDGDASAPAARS